MSYQQVADGPIDCEWLTESREFVVVSRGRSFTIVVLLLAFAIYYFALLLGAAYWSDVLSIRIVGAVNVGMILAISQYPVAGLIAAIYVWRMRKFDKLIEGSGKDTAAGSKK
ncbi:DUF485 domain-containing protein [Cupriavidus necator]|nr:DUF485 domain-containing protein [Cupriavidus necator]MDX6008376.1 DUF485 domain-containing protein [Cupriavidus necator]